MGRLHFADDTAVQSFEDCIFGEPDATFREPDMGQFAPCQHVVHAAARNAEKIGYAILIKECGQIVLIVGSRLKAEWRFGYFFHLRNVASEVRRNCWNYWGGWSIKRPYYGSFLIVRLELLAELVASRE